MHTNNVTDLSAIITDKNKKTTSTGAERRKKRPAPLPPNCQEKQGMTDDHASEERTPNVISKYVDQSICVNVTETTVKAPANVQVLLKLAGEGLLKIVIKIENGYPQSSSSTIG
ncbi:unnamed protein product [Rotaria sordida]|uniref:Uncharacterized protein n=2 Tax=Rotaria sordida TaxID=392033 RepID=A0A815Y3W2_9BILA|nr:unnamed protein product [Rotaria sordida]CAF4195195.1 unnamed protein product [Rotaria sordida]